MAQVVGPVENTHEIVVFEVGGLVAALPAGRVEGAVAGLDIAPVRALPAGMLGAFAFRGESGGVVDLHWRLGLGGPPADWIHWYLIVSLERHYAGLRVDRVEGRLAVPGNAVRMLSVPGSGEGLGYLRGVVHLEQRRLPLLDPDLLVSPAAIEDVIARAA